MFEEYLNKCQSKIYAAAREGFSGDIYHYTSPKGYKSIVQNSCMWFSERIFLNDKTEGYYVFDVLINNIDKIITEENVLYSFKQEVKDYCNQSKNMLPGQSTRIFVASFSTESDSLPLWNYYTKGDTAVGYNLEFDSMKLKKSVEENVLADVKAGMPAVLMHKVIYDTYAQVERLRKIFEYYSKQFRQYCVDTGKEPRISGNELKYYIKSIVECIVILGVFYKPTCFAFENEVRIALMLEYEGKKCINMKKNRKTRQVHKIKIPYYEIDVDMTLLKGIHFSPTNDYDVTLSDSYEMCFNLDLTPQFYKSEIPVRY